MPPIPETAPPVASSNAIVAEALAGTPASNSVETFDIDIPAQASAAQTPPEIAYGNHNAPQGMLPIATLIPGCDAAKGLSSSVALAQPGAVTQLGGPSRLRAPLDAKRWLLWATLVLGAGILGWMAYRLARQTGTAPAATTAPGGGNEATAPRRD